MADRNRGRATEVRRVKKTERMIERDREKGMPRARYACGKIDMKTERRVDMETERQSYREAGIHIDRHRHIRQSETYTGSQGDIEIGI